MSILNFPGNVKTPTIIGTYIPYWQVSDNESPTSGTLGTVTVKYQDGTQETVTIAKNGYVEGGFFVKQGLNLIDYNYSQYNTAGSSGNNDYHYQISIYGVSSKFPLKPWTNGEVMDRLEEI